MIVKRIVQECRAHPVKISSCEPGRFIDCLTAGTPNPKGSQMFARDLKPGLVILTGWLVGTGSSIAQTNFAAQANGGVASASSSYSLAYPRSGANNGGRKGINWGNGGGWADATVDTYPDWLQITFIRRRTLSTRRSSGLVDAVNGTRGKR